MKRKLRFIMPRLIGATVVVGLAALIITTLFKLLLGLVVLGGVLSIIGRKAGRNRQQFMGEHGQQAIPVAGKMNAFGNGGPWADPTRYNNNFSKQARTTIVPIN